MEEAEAEAEEANNCTNDKKKIKIPKVFDFNFNLNIPNNLDSLSCVGSDEDEDEDNDKDEETDLDEIGIECKEDEKINDIDIEHKNENSNNNIQSYKNLNKKIQLDESKNENIKDGFQINRNNEIHNKINFGIESEIDEILYLVFNDKNSYNVQYDNCIQYSEFDNKKNHFEMNGENNGNINSKNQKTEIILKENNNNPKVLNLCTLTSIPNYIISLPNLHNLFSKLESRIYFLQKLDERRCHSCRISEQGFLYMTTIMKVLYYL